MMSLELARLGPATDAGLWITSLPWPRQRYEGLTLGSQATFAQPIGQWPGEASGTPRRILMVADGENAAPERIRLGRRTARGAAPTALPAVEMELIERSPHMDYVWERHLLRIRYAGRSIGIAMGLGTGGTIYWWEACRLLTVQQTEQCLVIEMGGVIAHRQMTLEELKGTASGNKYLHRHNWLNGHIYARLHANGVCEIYAHHINSKFVDDGLHLDDVIPVIGFKSDASPLEIGALIGEWGGTRDRLELGGVKFDVSEAARLATPQQPGQITHESGFVVWQPYLGVHVFGGSLRKKEAAGDPYLCRAEQHKFPRGMARTIQFSMSLSDRSPRVARYLAPNWWYGACEELLPEPLLPVSNEYDESVEAARQWIQTNITQRGFEDGSVPRDPIMREEGKQRMLYGPGWEGEVPYAQFLAAWRSGDAADYASALRSAYNFTDTAVDHAAKLVRLIGMPFGAFALPMMRMQGTIAAYLETGDPYLLRAAEAVVSNAHSMNMNSWPRLAVGRDACYVRSAVLLYRYFADEYFRKIAFEGAKTVVDSQNADGSFGDQGGGAGIHAFAGYVIKPWMGLLALNGVLDYLELFPSEETFKQAVKKFADWLLTERWEHDGAVTWSYQHFYDGRRRYFCIFSDRYFDLPHPGRWHQETLARLLGYSTFEFSDLRYLDAWAESYRSLAPTEGDHAISAALQFLPWLQAKLWNATLVNGGISVRPVQFGALTPSDARIITPNGEVEVRWNRDGIIHPPTVHVASLPHADALAARDG